MLSWNNSLVDHQRCHLRSLSFVLLKMSTPKELFHQNSIKDHKVNLYCIMLLRLCNYVNQLFKLKLVCEPRPYMASLIGPYSHYFHLCTHGELHLMFPLHIKIRGIFIKLMQSPGFLIAYIYEPLGVGFLIQNFLIGQKISS